MQDRYRYKMSANVNRLLERKLCACLQTNENTIWTTISQCHTTSSSTTQVSNTSCIRLLQVTHAFGYRKCFQVMSVAYNSSTLQFPVEVLAKLLLYNNVAELLHESRYYGLTVKPNGIIFTKISFNCQKTEVLFDSMVIWYPITANF